MIEAHVTTAICIAWKQRMPNYICLGQASKCLLKEKFSPNDKNWKFVIIIEIFKKVRLTRKNVPSNKRFFISKVKFKVNSCAQKLRSKTTVLNKRRQEATQWDRLGKFVMCCYGNCPLCSEILLIGLATANDILIVVHYLMVITDLN